MGFVSVIYPVNSVVVAPLPLAVNAANNITYATASAKYKAQDPESRLPNKEELTSMFYNAKLLNMGTRPFWSGSVIKPGISGTVWFLNFEYGDRSSNPKTVNRDVRCVKK